MKLFFPLFLITSLIQADVILYKTLACPKVDMLKKAPIDLAEDSLKLEMYTIANSCVILNRGDSVEALGYDPRNSRVTFQEILYKKTNRHLYMLREAIEVEQAGKKNQYRF